MPETTMLGRYGMIDYQVKKVGKVKMAKVKKILCFSDDFLEFRPDGVSMALVDVDSDSHYTITVEDAQAVIKFLTEWIEETKVK